MWQNQPKEEKVCLGSPSSKWILSAYLSLPQQDHSSGYSHQADQEAEISRNWRLCITCKVPFIEAHFYLLGPTSKRLPSLPKQHPQLGIKHESVGCISVPVDLFIPPEPCFLVFWQIECKVEKKNPIILFPLRTIVFFNDFFPNNDRAFQMLQLKI